MADNWRCNAKVYKESEEYKTDKIDKRTKRNNMKKENNREPDKPEHKRGNDYRTSNNDYRNSNNDYRNSNNDYRKSNNDYRNSNNDYRKKDYGLKKRENKNRTIVPIENKEKFIPINNYLEKCKIKQEEDTKKINLNDPEYWRENIWIGPKYLKHRLGESLYNKTILENINFSKNRSTIIIQGRVLYSRNNEDWYSSWKETFTDEEWFNQKEQEEREELMKSFKKYSEITDARYLERKQESYEHYYQTGELDIFGQVEKEHEEYEIYLERLEKEEKEYQELEDIMLNEDVANVADILSDDDNV